MTTQIIQKYPVELDYPPAWMVIVFPRASFFEEASFSFYSIFEWVCEIVCGKVRNIYLDV